MKELFSALLKVLMEVLADVFVQLLSRPDVVAPEVKPAFDSLETTSSSDASDDLLGRFDGLLDKSGSDLLQGNAAP